MLDMGALSAGKLSVHEYLDLDRKAEIPSEYHDGGLFPIEAVTMKHSAISVNLIVLLKKECSPPCHPFGAPLRVRVSPARFVLPDLMVVCGKPETTDEYHDTITNPKFIA